MTTKVVKKELLNDDIKEFGEDAATAINELLGLYGYEDDTKRNELTVKFHRNSCKKIANISQKLLDSKRQMRRSESESIKSQVNEYSSVSSERDGSSSGESSKSPLALKLGEKDENNCSWCHHDISPTSTEIIGSQGTVFCSENCFLFWRRASFKRAKTCDYCKSVRNAVSYVDFNDGATQLQFCSDKCLNQYKMQIFCRETQAHLELNPHLKETKEVGESLITPDLWLKNCRSRSPSPDALPRSPTPPTATAVEKPTTMTKIIVTQSQPSSSSTITSSSRMPPPPPPDDPNHYQYHQMNNMNSLVPPPVILVPHPVILPIVIPVPLPLSAFWNAYRTKKSSTETTEHDNDTHRRDGEEAVVLPAMEKTEESEEQPLDYTTSKSPENNDNNLPLHDDDDDHRENENENENGID
ncbi:CLUMA_CG012697, isoform A, partial [Clunio marinus]